MSRPGGLAPRRQHYVSQALLSRFVGTSSSGLIGICQIGILDGRVHDPRPSKSMGFEWELFKYRAKTMEELWGTVEAPMGRINAVLRQNRPEALASDRTVVTDFIALHFARSLETKRVHHDSFERVQRQTRANREMQLRLAQARYPMLDLSMASSVLDDMAEAVLEPLQALDDKGSFFQGWVEEVFAHTRHVLGGYSVSLRPAEEGYEYLLGDCPAVGIAAGMNPRIRPPLLDAKAIVMPLSPKFAAMVYPRGPEDPGFSIDPAGPEVVSAINHGQIAQAHRRVY